MILEVFVATRLVNPTNRRECWAVRAKRVKQQREAVILTCRRELKRQGIDRLEPSAVLAPKQITLTACVSRRFDDHDNLRAALKPIVDALGSAAWRRDKHGRPHLVDGVGLIHDDGPDSGHEFTYAQVVAKPLGVRIRVGVR